MVLKKLISQFIATFPSNFAIVFILLIFFVIFRVHRSLRANETFSGFSDGYWKDSRDNNVVLKKTQLLRF